MRTLVACVLTALVTMMLTIGWNSPGKVEAQTVGGKSDLISKTVQWAKDCAKLDNDGQALTARWNQISSTISSPTDFTGTNAALTKAQMTSVFTTIGNIHTTYIAGNNTNVEAFQ